tara:strand:- start:1657 stop:1938 length:282 start_codon:yes stop_codon:yes gene_type:complete
MRFTLKNIFRIIAILEGVSYVLLLIATPIKYLLDNEQYVKALGMPHGVLFILYIVLAFFIQRKMKWDNKKLIIVMLASVVPFGTFYVDYKYLD